MSFKERVLKTVRNIPAGRVMTYKSVASATGNSKACRAVGQFMKENFDVSVPCHRVVPSSLKVGNYNRGGESVKAKMLMSEGVLIERGMVKTEHVL